MEQVFPNIVTPALHREQAQFVGEPVLEQDDVDQDTDRHADGASHHHRAVGLGAAHESHGQRQRYGDQGFQDSQRDQHGHRWPEAGQDDVGHRFAGTPAGAEVEGNDLLDEDPELDVVRLVDAQLGTDVGDLLRVRHLPGQDIGRVATDPVEQEKYKYDDAEHGRQHLPEASQDISGHDGSLIWLNAGVGPKFRQRMPCC